MKILANPFPTFTTAAKHHYSDGLRLKNKCINTYITKASVKPPPPEFDFRTEILSGSQTAIAETHPELLDLANNGSLVLVTKNQYGPVPSWRTEFAEPEAIWLFGTTHISKESADDVGRVIRAVKPDNVVVELCRSRAGIMYTCSDGKLKKQLRSSMFSLSGTGFFGAVGRSLGLGGQTALALRLLLAAFSSKLSSEINRPFGDEFRAARKAAEEIGAQMVLGDRPIEITLERAWNSLIWKEKLSLLTSVIGGLTSLSDLSMKTLKESSAREENCFQLYEQLSFSYPSLLQPLIHERDTYLAWSLKRSKAVNNSKQVVGVIGKGHMNGVIYSLISDQGNLRFRDLAGQRASGDGSTWLVRALRSLIRDTALGILLWLLYEKIKTG
ncbi:traB domain-containing protein isoform X1 [Coffea eugenioides]|uniref:traB domain-containing protein isoform X1 n=1 Tax=Coffea eugenioides TaxID=49369 RepID=UPI000F608404|nr:traB domain-containing protein isoform X1 [Coffea eugenioides]